MSCVKRCKQFNVDSKRKNLDMQHLRKNGKYKIHKKITGKG